MKTLIIGIGNEFRSDDRVGLLAARELLSRDLDADVREASGEGASLMDCWEGYDHVILIDATRSGAAPGTVHMIDATHEPIPSSFFNYSTHAFSVAEAVEMARALGRLPASVHVYGIEGQSFSNGLEISGPAGEALYKVVEMIVTSDINTNRSTRYA